MLHTLLPYHPGEGQNGGEWRGRVIVLLSGRGSLQLKKALGLFPSKILTGQHRGRRCSAPSPKEKQRHLDNSFIGEGCGDTPEYTQE